MLFLRTSTPAYLAVAVLRLVGNNTRSIGYHHHYRRVAGEGRRVVGPLWYGVCPPVCSSTGPQQQTRCCRIAAVGPTGRRVYFAIKFCPELCA